MKRGLVALFIVLAFAATALATGTAPYTIQGSDTVRDALKVKAKGNFDDIYSKVDPDNAKGAYADVATRLDAMDTLITSAGSGTAYTVASATEPSSPPDGMVWIDTSANPPVIKIYDLTNTTWITVASTTIADPILNGDVSGTGVLDDDTMATASDTTLATSESIKAYVDAMTWGADDITSGTLVHERGGLEADVSGYDGLVYITGGATSARSIYATVQKGFISGLLWQYASATSYTVGSGAIDIAGSIYYVTSTITESGLTGLSNDTYYYIKIAAPGSGTSISGTEISLDATTPSWSDTYNGWYISTSRVIGWVLTDGSGNLEEAYVSGGAWILVEQNTEVTTTSPPTSVTSLAINVPALGRMALDIRLYLNNGTDAILYAYNATATSGASVTTGIASSSQGASTGLMLTDSSQQIGWKCSTGTVTNAAVLLSAVYIPAGMAGAK